MVGDSPIADIEGVQAAGLSTVWMDRGTWPDCEHRADYVVADATEAIAIMRGDGHGQRG
jgi:putative hydrolase of the HAD superfamily